MIISINFLWKQQRGNASVLRNEQCEDEGGITGYQNSQDDDQNITEKQIRIKLYILFHSAFQNIRLNSWRGTARNQCI